VGLILMQLLPILLRNDNSNIVAVASITSTGALSSFFSNYGATSVDIGAPGIGDLVMCSTSSKT